MKLVRCAVYTRKSTEEGLEQDYNSLAAQRDACEAYIRSQAGEGWKVLARAYDDGGFSGDTMERPALQTLLNDIESGNIDVVVVYKVDRLTRSLMDFSKIVERFDARGVSFVSVTQSFNTTTSMGRLTLNVLLSFAQFEREVTGERIRDKIAASKQKGMWMGGTAPLGYKPNGRSLAINEQEAALVRSIFERYLTLGSLIDLADALKKDGVRSKITTYRTGRTVGGGPLYPGALGYMLSNRTYVGEIRHGQKWYLGQHPPLMDAALFEKVQAALARNKLAKRRAVRANDTPLIGLLFDDAGYAMSPSFAVAQSGRRHRYYVSQAKLTSRDTPAGSLARISADAIERAALELARRLISESMAWADLRDQLVRVTLSADCMQVVFKSESIDAEWLGTRLREYERADPHEGGWIVRTPFNPRRWRGASRELDAKGRPRALDAQNRTLARALSRAHAMRRDWLAGQSIAALAGKYQIDRSDAFRTMRLAYLAPDIVRAALAGTALQSMTARDLMRLDLPLDWDAQRKLLLVNI